MAAPTRKSCSRKLETFTFIPDEEISEHIVDIGKGAKNSRTVNRRKAHASSVAKNSLSKNAKEKDEVAEDGSFSDFDEILPPTEILLEGKEVVSGLDVYSFKKTKHKGQMSKAARSACNGALGHSVGSSSESSRSSSDEDDESEPSEMASEHEVSEDTPVKQGGPSQKGTPTRGGRHTPGRASAKTPTPAKHSARAQNSASTPKTPVTSGRTRRSKRRDSPSGGEGQGTEGAEAYFDAHHDRPLTSNRTLAGMSQPRLSQEELFRLLEGVPPHHLQERAALADQHRRLFATWMLQLCNGFSILVYGFGSKKSLLESFHATCLKDFSCLLVNGFFPNLTIKQILNSITEELLEYSGTFHSLVEQGDCIRKLLSEREESIFVIIHNIDGVMLRNEKSQAAFSQIGSIPNLHIVASVDHINASLLWDQAKANQLKWLMYDATTYESYGAETSYENSLMLQESAAALALSSLLSVLRSLTPNARGIFDLLVDYQLLKKTGGSYIGMPFQELYRLSREAFFINSDVTLRTQLTEFRDHQLIKSKKGSDGGECLYIPVDHAILKEYIEMKQNQPPI